MKISAILFGLIVVTTLPPSAEIQGGTISTADAAIGTIKQEHGEAVKVDMLRTKVKQDAKPTKVKEEVYAVLEKRGETEAEPEETPVEGAEDGPDECPCGQCRKGAKSTAV